MVIKLTREDIFEMTVSAAKQILKEEAGVAKEWEPVFEYIGNEIWHQLAKGAKRLKDKLRKDGTVLKRGERRGPDKVKFEISLETLKEIDKTGRLPKLFPNGLIAKSYPLQGFSFGKTLGWVSFNENIISLGVYEYMLPIESDGDDERMKFVEELKRVGMHEVTHLVNGPSYTKNHSSNAFESGRKDRPWNNFGGTNPHDIAYTIEYLFKPGEMHARVSGFYYGAIEAMKKVPNEFLTSKESIKNDIEILNGRSKGYFKYGTVSMSHLPSDANPRIDDMVSAIEKLSNEKYETYESSLKNTALHSTVACLLTYPEGLINVRKYGKIIEKGYKTQLRSGAEPKEYEVEVIVSVKPEDGYSLNGKYSVVDKNGEHVGMPLSKDIYEYDEDGHIRYEEERWGSQNQYVSKKEVEKNKEDVVVTGFNTWITMPTEEFKSRFGNGEIRKSGNLEMLNYRAKWDDDDYEVPYVERKRFSDKIVDEESFNTIKEDMVRQLSEKLEDFKKRIYKVYYMAMSETIQSRESDNKKNDVDIENSEI